MILHPEDIYYVFLVDPNGATPQRKILAKYAITDGKLSVLEDHGLGVDLESMDPKRRDRFLNHLAQSQRTEVVSLHDVLQGHHDHHIKEVEDHINPDAKDHEPLKLKYDHPQLGRRALEIHDDTVYLDGHKLTDEEVEYIMAHVKSGDGRVSHTRSVSLEKSQPELYEALGALKDAVRAGAVQPEAYKILSRHIFKDTMIPSVGNKLAYEDFLSRPKEGVHIHLDGDHYGLWNKKFGYHEGDKAIKTLFEAVRAAVDESVGRKHMKCFRISGDEGRLFAPTMNHANAFARVLQEKLANLPGKDGLKHGATLGMGATPEEAEANLVANKQAKKTSGSPDKP